MSVVIKKYNGNYHIINHNLFCALQKNSILCENKDLDILNEADTSIGASDFIKSLLKQNGYDIEQIKDKRVQNFKINTIINSLNDDYSQENIKNVIKKFIDDENKSQSNNLQLNNQHSSEVAPQTTSQQKVDYQNEDNTSNNQNNQDVQDIKTNKNMYKLVDMKHKALLSLMKKTNMLDKIIALANKNEKQNYTEENIPLNILYYYAEQYTPFRNKLLTTRFRNQLKDYNLPPSVKNDIINLYKTDEKKKSSIRNILSSPKLKEKNQFQSAYDFPIADYYINKYNNIKSKDVFNRIATIIFNVNNQKTNVDHNLQDNVESICNKLNIKQSDSIQTIKHKLLNNYSKDIFTYLINYNQNTKQSFNLNDLSDTDLLNMIQENRFMIVSEIDTLINEINMQLRNIGLFPYIDYIMSKSNYTISSLESDTPTIAKVNIFSSYSISQILNKITTDENIKAKWKTTIPSRNISAIYDDYYNIIFINREQPEISFQISFISGFVWLKIIKKNFEKGKQAGRNWKGFIK